MASLTATLTLSSTTVSSDALSFSVTDTANVVAPIENVARIIAATSGGDSVDNSAKIELIEECYKSIQKNLSTFKIKLFLLL